MTSEATASVPGPPPGRSAGMAVLAAAPVRRLRGPVSRRRHAYRTNGSA
jgi:hypothetical protein